MSRTKFDEDIEDMLGDPTSGEKTNIGEYWKEEIKKAIAKARGE
jgi:hypothetical protein